MMPTKNASRLSVVVTALATASCADPVFIQHEEYYTPEGKSELYLGGSCIQVPEDSATGTGAGGENLASYGLSYTGKADGVELMVTAEGKEGHEVVTRSYSREFLLSGAVDELVVELKTGTLRLRHWGGSSCDPVRAPDAETGGESEAL